MNFMQVQMLIFLSIILCSILGGKKGTFLSTAVWAIETFIIYKSKSINYIQVVTLALSFQVGLVSGVTKDFIVKAIKKRKAKKIEKVKS